MEGTQKEAENNKSTLYVILAAVVVVILLGVGYFKFFGPSPLPDEFFSLYNYQDAQVKKTIPALLYDYGAISKAIGAKDNLGAATEAKKDLVQSLKNQAVSDDVQKKTTELKLLLSQISDTTLREKVTNLFGQMDDRNNRMQAVITAQTSTFTVLRDHFGALAVGSKGPELPQNIDSVIQNSQREIQNINQLQTTIDVAYDEITKLAGVDTTVSQNVDTIRMNLSATPEKEPTITDFPTPTPTPSLAPTATPVASVSAATTASASAQ